tara:strand:+ start:5547 stop:5744 length:198 start_codon:yes stop_codon:yes gene_type:complete
MLIIPVKEGESIDKALKRFKRKFDKTGKLKSLRDRQYFVKPSVKHRDKIIKASYIQKLRDSENNQ